MGFWNGNSNTLSLSNNLSRCCGENWDKIQALLGIFVWFWLDVVKAEQRSIFDLKSREKVMEPVINYTL